MKLRNINYSSFLILIGFAVFMAACQKMDRPPLGDYPEDPKPPALQILGAQAYWPFDGSARDTGELKLQSKPVNVSFVDGVTVVPDVSGGQAAQIGANGYVMVNGLPDALKSPGSFSVAFWMKGAPGPVNGGAQGLFAIANSKEFWGNFELFLENYKDADDPNAVLFKMHFYNANMDNGGEVWIDNDDVKIKNVLNKWTHVAVVYDGATSKLSLYKDGKVTGLKGFTISDGNYGNLKWANASGLVIGSFSFQTDPPLTNHGPEGWARSFNGALDQFRVYTKALTAEEVKNLFDNKL